MGQQIIYVEGKGFIPIQSGQTVQDAIAGAGGPAEVGSNELSIKPPGGGESIGFKMPQGQMSQGPEGSGGPEDILRAFPQLAGLIAQFTPAGRTLKGAAGIPAGTEALMQAVQAAISGKEFDPMAIAKEGAIGGLAGGAGQVVGAMGRGGENIVRRALKLGSGPFAYNEVAEQAIPKRLIAEKATMTKPGVAALEAKAQQTGSGGMADAAEALKKARYDADNSPNLGGGGIISMISDLIGPPRQMAVGSALAAPFGASTENAVAPGIETAIRALMAYLTLGGDQPEPPAGPRRRSQQ